MSNSEKPKGTSPRGPIKPVPKPAIKPAAKPGAVKPAAKPASPVKPAAKPATPAKPAAKAPTKPAATPASKPATTASKDADKKSTIMSASAKKTTDNDPLVKADKDKGGDDKGGNKLTGIIMPILLVLLAAGMVILYGIHSGIKEDHKKEIELQTAKYDELLKKYEDLLSKNDGLIVKLNGIQSESDSVNNMVMDLIGKLKNNKIKISGLYNKIGELKNRPDVSQAMLDSFERERARQLEIIGKLSKSNEIKALEISTLKEQVSELQNPNYEELVASDIDIVGLYEKKGEDIVTNKIKKIEYLEIMFYVDENENVKPGMKTFYFAVSDEDGNVMDDNGSITLNKTNQTVAYTFSGHVNYPFNGVETKSWIKPDNAGMKKGKYTVTIYNKDVVVGTKKIDLK